MYQEYETVTLGFSKWGPGEPENPEDTVLRWDESTQTMVGYLPHAGRLIPGEFDTRHLEKVKFLQDACTKLLQRGRNHPADHGLVPREVRQGLASPDELFPGHEIVVHTSPFPQNEVNPYIAWFAPDADPYKFGALYVGHQRRGLVGEQRTHWFLGQVGLNNVIESARWDDEEGCATIFGKAAEQDEETVDAGLVASALTVEDFAARRAATENRARKLRARDAFTRLRDRVKPRLIEAAWEDSSDSGADDPLWAAAARNKVTIVCEPVSLDDSATFCDPKPKPVNIAVKVEPFPDYYWSGGLRPYAAPEGVEPLVPSDFDSAAVRWQAKLDERNLGAVCRYQATVHGRGPFPHLIAVKNPEMMFEHAAACGIPDSTLVEKLTVDGSGGAVWEPLGVTNYIPEN